MSGLSKGSPGCSDGKESACNAGDQGPIPELGKIPWRRKWHPTPVFLPGKSYGWRSLAGYSPWGHKQSNTTERLAYLLGSHTSSPSMWFVLAPSRFDRGRVRDKMGDEIVNPTRGLKAEKYGRPL